MSKSVKVWNKAKPYMAMILLQFGYAGLNIITLISLKRGFSHWTLVVYRHAFATLVFAPFAYFLERNTRPQMTRSVLLKILLLAFLEPVLGQNLYYVGMQYASATFASVTDNILPAVTFIMAVLFRLEKVNLKQRHFLAKVIGTLITVSGALIMTLYKGPVVNFLPHAHGGGHHGSTTTSASGQHWVTGTILLLCCMVGWAAFFIVQNKELNEYPAPLSMTTFVCFMGTVQGGIAAVAMEQRKSAWALGFNSGLLAASYNGIICSGLAYYLQGVVNKLRGPVFVTAFTPLSMVITAVLAAVILAELIHLGSLIGAVIIVFGLYAVVWGESKEKTAELAREESSHDHELPVVRNEIHEQKC